MQGWIKLHRKSMESSIWKNPIAWFVWSWCLLKANHDKHNFPFNGVDLEIKEGEFITGRNKALLELPEVSCQQYRTAIKYLVATQRITIKSNNKFSLIKINKWNEYQDTNQLNNQPITNQQPATNQPITTYKNDNNEKNEKKVIRHFVPPTLEEITNYCSEQKNSVNPSKWLAHYEANGWLVGRNKMKDWKASIRTWEHSDFNQSSKKDEDFDDYVAKLRERNNYGKT